MYYIDRAYPLGDAKKSSPYENRKGFFVVGETVGWRTTRLAKLRLTANADFWLPLADWLPG